MKSQFFDSLEDKSMDVYYAIYGNMPSAESRLLIYQIIFINNCFYHRDDSYYSAEKFTHLILTEKSEGKKKGRSGYQRTNFLVSLYMYQ